MVPLLVKTGVVAKLLTNPLMMLIFLSSPNSDSLVDYLVSPGDHTVLAYSGSQVALELNLDSGNVDFVFNLSGAGIKFTCDQSSNSFVVKQNVQDTEITYAGQTFVSKGTHFDAGSCIPQAGTSPRFLIIDSVASLSILNGLTQTLHQLSDSCSPGSQCKDIFIYPGSYLVLLRSGFPDQIVVYDGSLRVVLNVEHTVPYTDVALLFDFVPNAMTCCYGGNVVVDATVVASDVVATDVATVVAVVVAAAGIVVIAVATFAIIML